jgi:hypothetical protein
MVVFFGVGRLFEGFGERETSLVPGGTEGTSAQQRERVICHLFSRCQ